MDEFSRGNNERMMNYYSLHNLVTVKTNINLNIPSYFKTDKVQNPDIEFIQKEFHTNSNNRIRTRNFYYWTDDKRLYIDYNIPFINARAVINDLNGKTKIQVTKDFLKYSRIGIPIRAIIQLKLIQKGFSLIHAGCLNYDGESVLIVAPRDSGKTSTILSLLKNHEFDFVKDAAVINDKIKFMSDDLTIISNHEVAFSYPEQIDVSAHTLTSGIVEPYKSKIGRNYLLTLLLGRIFNIELTQKRDIPPKIVDKLGKISKVFILTGGKDDEGITEISKDEAVRKIFTATTDLINPMKEYILNLYSYTCNFQIFDLIVKQYNIIENAIWNADCFEVCSNDISKYSEMIKKVL